MGGTADGRSRNKEGSRDGSNSCAEVNLKAQAATPRVLFVLDKSGSMRNSYAGGESRWESACHALLDGGQGVIASLQHQVHFGAALYTGRYVQVNGTQQPAGPWPDLTYIAPGAGNLAMIGQEYRCDVSVVPSDGQTPTGESIAAMTRRLSSEFDDGNDTALIVVTDGLPDDSTVPNGINPNDATRPAVNAATVRAVQQAFEKGIRSYMISVAPGALLPQAHMDEMANAGIGLSPDKRPAAPSWTPGNVDELRGVLKDLVQDQLSCEVALEGQITARDQACQGQVTLEV
ncbi:MAG: hypothetical protein ACPGUV_06350, partial [Polyangiales bacterium]